MSTLSASFLYSVEDINQSIRGTNTLLRGVNAFRLLGRDIKQVWEKPTIAKIFWTAIQFTRAYNAFRRIYNLTMDEANGVISFTRIFPEIQKALLSESDNLSISGTDFTDLFKDLNVRADVFLDNRPVTIDKLDLTDLPDNARIMIQGILEEDAEITVADAQEILTSRIMHPEQSTGDLSASIGYMPEVFGTRIFANMYYSAWVEEGHDNFSGHHYMRDALSRAKLRLPEKIRTQINGLLLDETI